MTPVIEERISDTEAMLGGGLAVPSTTTQLWPDVQQSCVPPVFLQLVQLATLQFCMPSVILMCAVADAHAGYLGGYAAPAVAVAHAPVAHAPVAVAPAASSYANTYRVSQTARLLAAPAVAAAPVAYAAPAIHAPLAYAAPAVAAPLLKVH
ncbi:cuticle protein 38-like [Schistocerca cancellata]|uniref:cuticle protein 38-like n=1 Tax=Schistocerca cancellata TaxID=274614 RepID=UPI002118EFB1|nr:cuticle protein 38-like [Schistocerca cancellata]